MKQKLEVYSLTLTSSHPGESLSLHGKRRAGASSARREVHERGVSHEGDAYACSQIGRAGENNAEHAHELHRTACGARRRRVSGRGSRVHGREPVGAIRFQNTV